MSEIVQEAAAPVESAAPVEAPVAPVAAVDPVKAQLAAKDAAIASLTDQVVSLGGFKAEALAGRERIDALEEAVADAEARAVTAARQAADHLAAHQSTASLLASAQADVEHAQALAAAIKHFLG